MTELPPIPLMLRTRLAHATLQAIADDCGADILHIKGPAVDATLLPPKNDAPVDATAQERALPRLSADADVLVRPTHLKRFLVALKKYGWRTLLDFDTGGGADHSAVFWHAELCEADAHRSFPGIRLSPELAFARLWQDRGTQKIAHRTCNVPSVDAQRLLLLLHAARTGASKKSDVLHAWTESEAEHGRVNALAKELDAEVGLAAAIGRLGAYCDRPDYDLWRFWAVADTHKYEFWRSRLKAARSGRERMRVLTNPIRLKPDALTLKLLRPPTPRELLGFYVRRLSRNLRDLWAFAPRSASRVLTNTPSHRE